MSRVCPHCGGPAEAGDVFCVDCGRELGAGVPPRPNTQTSPPPDGSHSSARLPGPTATPAQVAEAGAEIIVEVETNRPHVQKHASQLRFRVTNNLPGRCSVTIRVRLHGQGRFVEQDTEEFEQRCRFSSRGDQYVFSFPFRGLIPGEIAIRELRAVLTRPDTPRRSTIFELPDQSLFVQVTDPTMGANSPGIVISGGINLNFSQLKEMYGADIKNVLNLNAEQQSDPAHAPIQWQPIRLRLIDDMPPPPQLRLNLPGEVVMEFRRIPAGQFDMGSPQGQGPEDERPLHGVNISRDFWLGTFPVTQAEYQALVGENPSKFPLSPRHPVDNVSWEDANEFCRRLQAHLTQSPDALNETSVALDTVGLPREAEWEYACRAGTETLYSFGDDRKQLTDHGWFDKNAERTTHPVGQLKPNLRGLFDMHGNVWEWCEDFHAPDYSSASGEDPTGPQAGDRRVLRGGSWNCYSRQCRSASRHAAEPDKATHNYGFRVGVRLKSRP